MIYSNGYAVNIDSSKLQDCPICGDFDGVYSDFEDRIGNYHFIACYHCGLQAPSHLNRDMQKAADGSVVKWNLFTLFVRITELKLD